MSAILPLIAIYNLYLYKKDNSKSKFILFMFIAFTILSVLTARYNADTFVYKKENIKNRVEQYRVMSMPIKYNNYNLYIIKSEAAQYNKLLQTDTSATYTIGEYIEVKDQRKNNTITNSKSADIKGAAAGRPFDYSEYIFYKYKADRIFKLYESKSHSLNKFDKMSLAEKIKLYKYNLENKLYQYHNSENFELIAGIIYGRDITLSRGLHDDLRSSGLSHIAVMSGYNLLIMFAIIYFAFKYISKLLEKFKLYFLENIYVRTGLALLLITILPVMNNWDAPIMRAYVFVIIASIYTLSGRVENYKYILLVTTLIIFYISPHQSLYDVGLHLSLLAVTSLVYFEGYFYKLFNNKLKLGEASSKYISVTVAAQILTTPYIIFVFGNYNVLSIISNLCVGVILPILTIAGLIETLLLSLNLIIIEKVFYIFTESLTSYIIYITSIFK